MKMSLITIFFFFFFFLHCCSKTSAQGPAKAPSGPLNITAILEKNGQFSLFIRLLGSTQQGDQINTQLNNSNQGLTVFAPTDNAFSSLKAGTLNSLSDEQKIKLVQFHVLPTMMSATQFQTTSNPIRTQAGNSAAGEFPLNITTSGNQVNLTTGVNQASVSNTLFTGRNLAVYQVDSVLLPAEYFGSPAPATAPAPSKSDKDVPVSTPKASTSDNSVNAAGAVKSVPFGVAVFAAIAFWL
ncbi:hypothetical protein QYF36_021522 [Acer negundo]|nr:hypothetical protein QYF36_021522 [Acer negundo]